MHVFNMITGKNESEILTKDISCKCKCRFDGKKCNSNQWWYNSKCLCWCKNAHVNKKDYIWNPATCSCQNGKYLASIMDDSTITCDEIIVERRSYLERRRNKTYPTNFNEKNTAYKTQNFYILLTFLWVTIALLIAVSICFFLVKY